MKIDDFIKTCDVNAKDLKNVVETSSCHSDIEKLILAQTALSCVLIEELAGAIKEENTNLLRAMPCGCDPLAPKQFNYKCERCKQLEEREKE